MKSCLPGKTFIKKVRSKVELKNTELGQNNKYFGGKLAQFWGRSKILGVKKTRHSPAN
jgi:hypothetical protein